MLIMIDLKMILNVIIGMVIYKMIIANFVMAILNVAFKNTDLGKEIKKGFKEKLEDKVKEQSKN